MSFILFFVYLTISIVIYGIIGVLIYNIYLKKKKDNFDSLLDNIFNSDDFDNQIHEIDNSKDFLKKVR